MSQRLNGIIRQLEAGKHSVTTFQPIDITTAVEITQSKYVGVVFEGEHQGWDITNLRHALQYMLNRAHIAKGGVARRPNCDQSPRLLRILSRRG